MLNLFSPISYNNMAVNPIVFNYFMGNTQGYNPFGYNLNNNWNSIFMPFNNYSSYFSPLQFNNPYNGMFNNYFSPINFYPNNDKFTYFGPYMNIFKVGRTQSPKPTTDNTKAEQTSTQTEVKESNNTSVKTTTEIQKETKSNYLGTTLAKNAKQYLGYNESDGSYRKFSDSGEWCADFVSYVVKETYQNKGLTPPAGFESHRVEELKQWGIKNNKYHSLVDKDNKADEIKNNISIGDILILRENGASHTGFISQINPDGSFETIEGNRNDQVAIGKYNPEDPEISGFIKLAS